MPAAKLDTVQLRHVLKTYPGWQAEQDGTALTKTFQFKNFVTAWGWMSQVAIWAEKLNHHPEWSNVYGRVTVVLTTHDQSGLTELDVSLLEKMEMLVE